MRDTFEWIDAAATFKSEERHALYDLAAQQIGTQAFMVACLTEATVNLEKMRQIVEKVAGYPGVTSRRMRPDSNTFVGDRAAEIALSLCRNKPGLVRD
jgi:non-ribosomal peptide synthetase component F